MSAKLQVEIRSTESITHSTIYLQLQDISRLDVPSQVLSETIAHGVTIAPDHPIILTIDHAETADPRLRPNLRVHVSQHGHRALHSGDLLTTETYPIGPDQTAIIVTVSPI
ncbi:MAG: hypothetical protein MUF87_09110 [Anaerolineae bacterium]|jgi:uncharacterized lipoprotein YbaY|nr:hypothetical protein [Anaerolineae bacterium]